VLERRQVDAEGRRSAATSPAAVMQTMSLGDDAEEPHAAHGPRYPEASVSHPVVSEDISRDVEGPADAEPRHCGVAEEDQRTRSQQRPAPQEIVPNDAPGGRVSMMGLMLAPERAVKREAMHQCHQRLGEDERRERHEESGHV